MPRPNKAGLDYFPLDVSLDDKMELIEAKHGLTGFGIIIKLYQAIYKNGYFMDATEERLLLFKKKVNVDINDINAIIKDAFKWGIFDEKLYRKYNILTSHGIQKRFIEASKRRKEVDFIKEYLLIANVANEYSAVVNVNIYSLNVDNNKVNVNCDMRKKEKKRKEEHICSDFVAFWSAYPRKVDKKKALEAWKKSNGNRPPLETVLQAIKIQSQSKDWKKDSGQFIPYPSTWLNAQRWEDDPNIEISHDDDPPYW